MVNRNLDSDLKMAQNWVKGNSSILKTRIYCPPFQDPLSFLYITNKPNHISYLSYC